MFNRSCVFCQIIRRGAPATLVYEDDTVMAFLINRPVNVGHTLVVPKKHYVNIYEIPEEEVANLFIVAKRVAQAASMATGNEHIRIIQNNGVDAGQVIFHLHVHIIPMKPQNHLKYENQVRPYELLEEDAEKIRRSLM